MSDKKSLFTKPHHIAIVVRDLDKAVEYYESIGIGPFQDYPPLTDYVKLDVPDEKGFFGLKFRFTKIGDLFLQLCQPGEGRSIYRDHLETKGEGVFHIGFEVPDASAADREVEELGLTPLATGRRQDGSGFSYLDTADQAGVVLLVRQSPPVD